MVRHCWALNVGPPVVGFACQSRGPGDRPAVQAPHAWSGFG